MLRGLDFDNAKNFDCRDGLIAGDGDLRSLFFLSRSLSITSAKVRFPLALPVKLGFAGAVGVGAGAFGRGIMGFGPNKAALESPKVLYMGIHTKEIEDTA